MSAPTVIILTNAVLKVADTEAGLTTGTAYECQVNEAAINVAPNLETVPATLCAPESQKPAASSWTLALTWLQDWTAPAGGLSGFAFTNDTADKWFSLSMGAGATPLATGQCRVVAGAYGGPAGTPLQASAEWPLVAKPTITMPAGSLLMADEDEAATAAAEAVAAVASVALRGIARNLEDLPRHSIIAVARAVKDIARDEARMATGDGRMSRVGRRGARLGARDRIADEAGSRVLVRIQGAPVGPWVWLNTGTTRHRIARITRGRRVRAQGPRGALMAPGWPHPVAGPVWHRGARGKGTWRRVVARSDTVIRAIWTDDVHKAVT